MPATVEADKQLTATPQSKEHAPTPVPRRPSRLAYSPPPGDEDARSFPGEKTQKDASPPSAASTAARPPGAPLPAEKQAGAIDEVLFPSMLASALQMDRYFDVKGYRAFLDRIFAGAGSPTDPVEVMLLQQLVLAHLRAAQLQAHAGMAEGLEAVRLYNAAAARLLAEFRKTALALKCYREAPARRDRTETPPPQPGAPAASLDLLVG
jgi:hypothetical protein